MAVRGKAVLKNQAQVVLDYKFCIFFIQTKNSSNVTLYKFTIVNLSEPQHLLIKGTCWKVFGKTESLDLIN